MKNQVPSFESFVLPIIRNRNRKYKPVDPHKFKPRVTNLRCPGCCGPVVAQFFEGYECDDVKKGDYYSYTCGSLEVKSNGSHRYIHHNIGPHGSLAYIEIDNEEIKPHIKKNLQKAIDDNFERLQQGRDDDLKEFEESGDEYVEAHGCFPGVIRRYVPKGRLKATTHDVDCVCRET